MKVYKLEVNSVQAPWDAIISTSHASRKTKSKTVYFLSVEKAKAHKDEINNAVSSLIGYLPSLEVSITEIEVIE